MTKKDYERSSLRAPLRTSILVTFNNQTFRSKIFNISETGILIKNIKGAKKGDELIITIDLPVLKIFEKLKIEKLLSLETGDFQRNIVGLRGTISRKFKGPNPNGKGEVNQLGIKFIDIPDFVIKEVDKYIERFEKNVTFLLHLIEHLGGDKENQIKCKKVAGLLSYDPDEKVSALRQMVLHDYRSLCDEEELS